MSKFNTISLDAADTLFYIKDGLGDSYNKILKKYSNNYESRDISNSFKNFFNSRKGLHFSGLTGPNLVAAEKKWWYELVFDVFNELGMIDDFDSYFDDLYEFFAKDAWEIFEDTLPFLEEAKKRNFKLIITSNFDSRIYNVCEHFGISKYIDCFTISSESGSSKPDPNFFFKSLSNANASLENTLHVGDNPKLDFLAAKEIGLACYLIDRDKDNSPSENRINSLNCIWDLIC